MGNRTAPNAKYNNPEWIGQKYKQTFSRIKYLGWPVEDALTIPLNTTRKWKRSERFCKQMDGV